ncbi:uncharacterized protein FYW61_013231 [Anableps anableps]
MGHVEICMNAGEDLKVVLHNNLRFLLRRMRVNDLQRRLVAPWQNCSCSTRRSEDASFILTLKALFVFCFMLVLSTCHLCDQGAGEDEQHTFVTGKEGRSENGLW